MSDRQQPRSSRHCFRLHRTLGSASARVPTKRSGGAQAAPVIAQRAAAYQAPVRAGADIFAWRTPPSLSLNLKVACMFRGQGLYQVIASAPKSAFISAEPNAVSASLVRTW